MRFNIPITDPRWLQATEEEIVQDMLVCMYFDAGVRDATNPGAALKRDLESNPDAYDDVDRTLLEDMTPEGEFGRRLAELAEPPPRIEAVRLGGRVVSRG